MENVGFEVVWGRIKQRELILNMHTSLGEPISLSLPSRAHRTTVCALLMFFTNKYLRKETNQTYTQILNNFCILFPKYRSIHGTSFIYNCVNNYPIS